jgi:hypothetical protein
MLAPLRGSDTPDVGDPAEMEANVSNLDRTEIAPDGANGGRPATTVIGHAPRRVNGAAGPLSSVTSPLAAVPARPIDTALWSGRLHRSLAVDIRLAVATGC